jgi:formylglycine-generating enzyme required for sulfatase activity
MTLQFILRVSFAAAAAGMLAPASATVAANPPAKAALCISCHGGDLKLGTPPTTPPKIVRQQPEYIARALRQFRSGERNSEVMRGVAAGLSDKDVVELADYFGGVRPLPARPAADSVMPKVVKQVCENCHGMTGLASLPEMPLIGGQHTDYLERALTAFRDGTRHSAVMSPIARTLSDSDIVDAARYYAAVTDYFRAPTDAERAAATVPLRHEPEPAIPHKKSKPLPKAAQKAVAERIASSIELVTLPAGSFLMGSPADEGDAPGLPQHTVSLRSFRMARNVVTFDQFDAFTRATGRAPVDAGGMKRGKYPAINTSMQDVNAFIDWLNRNTGRKFRLPSESEWEYAARAGTRTHYWWGDKPEFGRFNSFRNEAPDIWPGTSPVGAFPPNPFGLYDMTGNVFQRVSDCRRPTYDGKPADGSPVVGEPCVVKVMRGGSWRNLSGAARHATRSGVTDELISTSIGFRLVEDIR